MKKAGIMTFHRALNYGAILQAYALTHALREVDDSCLLIDYRCEHLENQYKTFRFGKNKIASFVKCALKSKDLSKKRKKFQAFVKSNIPMTSKAYTSENLNELNDEFHCLITGSDQVWSPKVAGFDPAFFLDFASKSKKFSYAASFGCDKIQKELQPVYNERLSGFEKISVREENAINLVKSLGYKRHVECSVDPSLLLTKNDWHELSKKPKEEKYILIFTVNKPKKLIQFARSLADATGLKLVYINDKPIFCEKGIKYYRNAGPEEFLGFIENAEYVVTNSFHGTAFSIIFNKNLFVEIRTKSGKNGRAENLLQMLKLQNRIIDSSVYKGNEKPIDWIKIDSCVASAAALSKKYIKNIIEVCNE